MYRYNNWIYMFQLNNISYEKIGIVYDGSNLKWGNNNNQRFNLRLTNKLKVFDNFSIESVIAYNRQDQVAPSQLNRTLTSSYQIGRASCRERV